MMPEDIKTRVSELTGFQLVSEMKKLGEKASNGDANSFNALSLMLADCQKIENWQNKGHYTSAVVYAVSQIKSLKAMQLIIKLIENLPEGIPSGSLELLAGTLPGFKRFVLSPVKQLVQKKSNSPACLIGIQTLCNLYLEDGLEGNDIDFLADKLKDFQTSDYSTKHVVDLVKTEMASRNSDQSQELENALSELLV